MEVREDQEEGEGKVIWTFGVKHEKKEVRILSLACMVEIRPYCVNIGRRQWYDSHKRLRYLRRDR